MQKICLYVGKGGERQEMKLTNQTSIRSALILPWWKGWSSFWICWVETKIFSRSLTRTAVGMYVSFLLGRVFMTDWPAALLCWLFDGLRSTLGILLEQQGFPGGSDDKEPTCSAGDSGLIPGLGRSPREGNGNPLQYSCLENLMDRAAWLAAVHGVLKSWTRLSK